MRSFDEFKATVYERHDNIKRKRAKRKRIIATCIPLVFCIIIAGLFINGNPFAIKRGDNAEHETFDEYAEEITDGGVQNAAGNEEETFTDDAVEDYYEYDKNYATSQTTETVAPDSNANGAPAKNDDNYSYTSTVSARIEVIDGETASMRLINDEKEAKNILQIITLTGAIDDELTPPEQSITVYIREYDKITTYYYHGDRYRDAPEGAITISAQVADGILNYLEEAK